MAGFMSPRLSSPMHPTQGVGGGGAGGHRGGPGGRGRGRGGGNMGRDRDLIGQTIKITQGPYKSHVGIVKVKTTIHSKQRRIVLPNSSYHEAKFFK